MPQTEPKAIPLTAQSVRELRKAQNVSFHLKSLGGTFPECFLNAQIIRDPDMTLRVDCAAQMTSYNGQRSNGFAMIQCADLSKEWSTFAKLLKANDEIRLTWTAGNNNQYVKDAGLHRDELRGEIWRKGKPLYSLLLDTSVCPENTARMIQH